MAVIEIQDERRILGVLNRERAWGAYAITDLDPPYRQYARFLGLDGDGGQAVILVYESPDFTSIIPHGNHEGVRRLFEEAIDLPDRALVLAREADIPAIESRYTTNMWEMQRLAMDASHFRPVEAVHGTLRPLRMDDLPALQALYAQEEQSVFQPLMLEHGIYVGAFEDNRLIAVAGTHTVSLRHGIATVGNVFTDPAYRGRGLGTGTTSAVISLAIERGVGFVALNVMTNNEPAIRAYRRLGFDERVGYWEGAVESLRNR